MNKRNMRKSKRNILGFVKYTALTLALICLFTGVYFIIREQGVFGKLDIKSNTYTMGDVSDINQADIEVTKAVSAGNVNDVQPLTSSNDKLPTIPSFVGEKGSETNPYVFLEVVPDLSQQSYSYFVNAQSNGLPYNPVTFSMEVGNGFKYLNKQSNWDSSIGANVTKYELKDHGAMTNEFQNKNLGFMTNKYNAVQLFDPDNDEDADKCYDVVKKKFPRACNGAGAYKAYYYYSDWLLKFHLTSNDISENDFNNMSVENLFNNNKDRAAANAVYIEDYKNRKFFNTTLDGDGNIKYDSSSDDLDDVKVFKKALKDSDNWAKVLEENPDVKNSFYIDLPAGSIPESDFNNLTLKQVINKYPLLFDYDDATGRVLDQKGDPISDKALNSPSEWKVKQTTVKNHMISGALVKVAPGTGDYTITANLSGSEGGKIEKTGTATDCWKYVEDDSTLDESKRCSFEGSNQWVWHPTGYTDLAEGQWLKLYQKPDVVESWGVQVPWDKNANTVTLSEKVFSYEYYRYVYTFKYAGLKTFDILKHSVFDRFTEQQYKDLNVQVLVVTPEMINEMDKNDTEDTVSYIERADIFYISQYYDGNGNVADDFDKLYNLYHRFVKKDATNNTSDKNTIMNNVYSFDDNDLEWFDCMKLIKRLSSEKNLPLMWTKLVGNQLYYGMENNQNAQVYVDNGHKNVKYKGTINNISKTFLITLQFNLDTSTDPDPAETNYAFPTSYKRTFMGDIFPAIKQMKLNDDQRAVKGLSNKNNAAKYTGWYERTPLAIDSSTNEAYKKRCYYIWNKFIFLPVEVSNIYAQNGPYDALSEYGYLPSYYYQNAFQNADDTRGGAASHGTGLKSETIDGRIQDDNKNVTVAGNTQSDNANMSIPQGPEIGSRMNMIIKRIMNNKESGAAGIQIKVHKQSKYYTKLSDTSILTELSTDAKYKNESNKYIYVNIGYKNDNKETGVIKKITLLNSAGDSKEVNLCYSADKNDVVDKSDILYSEAEYRPVQNGYEVDKGEYVFNKWVAVPYTAWKNGYNTIHIDWVARTSNQKTGSEFRPYTSNGFDEITIGEKTLFALE